MGTKSDSKGFSRRKFLKGVAGLGFSLAAIDAFGIEPDNPSFEHIAIPIKDLPNSLDGYKIALFSDIHWPYCTSAHYVRKAAATAMSFNPDLVAVPGDFYDEHAGKPIASYAGLLDALEAAPDGAVGTLGNHDHRVGASQVRRKLASETPIRLIENESILIERGDGALAIGGVGDLWLGRVRPEEAFRGIDSKVPRVLLSHNPDLAEQMATDVRVDLQLSGHTHGGQVKIPFGPAPWIPSKYGQKFRAGLVQGSVNLVYVTRGICSLHRCRFDCRPEITAITLRRATA